LSPTLDFVDDLVSLRRKQHWRVSEDGFAWSCE